MIMMMMMIPYFSVLYNGFLDFGKGQSSIIISKKFNICYTFYNDDNDNDNDNNNDDDDDDNDSNDDDNTDDDNNNDNNNDN